MPPIWARGLRFASSNSAAEAGLVQDVRFTVSIACRMNHGRSVWLLDCQSSPVPISKFDELRSLAFMHLAGTRSVDPF
jgi:hypothetical protein